MGVLFMEGTLKEITKAWKNNVIIMPYSFSAKRARRSTRLKRAKDRTEGDSAAKIRMI